MKILRDPVVLVSAAELGQIVGIDIETVKNWLRHGIISRTPLGGRQLRNRLFSADEVYRTARCVRKKYREDHYINLGNQNRLRQWSCLTRLVR